ncbi:MULTISPECIES: tRNA (guanosine(46)-N7)-methyltransferase TrmB [Helicobacter]|uniref:tRNA (guanosine(46)-N7)-methyltransferase TrmB n=1 Tax=Helicobacter TaxID=209 RepID=UPI00051CC299|nr:tRNA (guanosine(46)-N7)-methyltransferase TrmB [Helicobacter sp. MIT 03-1616]TLD88283.1 tRNA (guanosine(46)-N7)-methyltransferase TrmB [Helicobacter sp. MIT 03-1616]
MPHFLASNISLPSLPYMQEDFTFVYEAIKCNDANQSLILVEYKQNAFFLRKQKRATKNNSILKCEKSSAKVHTGVIKNALKILSKHQDSLISHNLNNNSPRQNLQSPYFKPIEFFLDFRDRFIMEIGFGSGRHLLHLAQNNPHRICIGVEIHTPSIEQILRQIELLGLENLFIINADARVLLEILPDSKADRIYLHFPVPWNKKPHRRVFSARFLQEVLRVLDENAFLHLRSDDEIYFKDTLNLALNEPLLHLEVYKNTKLDITSKYEARWERQQKDIYDMKIFKQNGEKNTKNVQNNQNRFSFDKILRKNVDNYTDFSYKKIAKDWFLHIDGLYCAGDVYVMTLCFGDFFQPQNAFLQIAFYPTLSAHYIGGDPIPTQAAIKAHTHLMQILTQE